MTYCVGLCLEHGLVFGSDSRTNAGVDYVTTYSKMYQFTPAPDRIFVLMSAGNLATTQEVVNHIRRDLDYPTGSPNLGTVRYLFEAAEYVGQASQTVQLHHASALQAAGISGETSLILGGQIAGQPHGLFLIYPQGNTIAASNETPYLQIGESKYGKPILDRLLHENMTLEAGGRIALASLDATAKSNVTVGPPFEIGLYVRDSFTLGEHLIFKAEDPYLQHLQEAWTKGLQEVFEQLPRLNEGAAK